MSSQAEQDKLRLFLAVAHTIVTLAQRCPTLLVMDDLHWADHPSVDLFGHLAFTVADTAMREPVPLLLIGTYRLVEAEERLARLIARLQREAIFQTLALPGLDESGIQELIQGLGLARPSHQLIATVREATQGNPLFIQEVLCLVEEAMRHRLLLSEGQTFQFAHQLIRHVFYSEPSGARHQRIHQQIAQTLERLYATNLEAHVLELAHHLVRAGPAAEGEEVIAYARPAGNQAFAGFAWSDAARYYEAALAAAEATVQLSSQDWADFHYWAGLAHYRDQDAGPSLDHYAKAIEGYRLVGDLRGLAWTLMDKTRIHYTLASVPYGTLVDVAPLEEVLAALGDNEPGLRGRISSILSGAYWVARQADQAEELAQQALALGQHLRDDRLCAMASFQPGLAQYQDLRAREGVES
jgi:tetratricopeptide (TPR) repeat protein